MKRIITLSVVLCLMFSLLAGCGSNEPASKTEETAAKVGETKSATEEPKLSGKIVFATNRTDKADNVLTDMAKEFMSKNPGTEVEIEAIKDPEQVLKTRMAANELPDVTLVLGDIKASEYSKYFAPLNDLGYNKDNIYFYENGLGNDSKLYKIVCAIGYDGIVYNKKVFAEAGITTVPKTVDEFYAVCETLKSKGIVPFASNFKDKWPLTWYSDSRLCYENTGNPNYINELVGKQQMLSDDGGYLYGLKFLRTMNEKGYLEKDLMSTNWDGCKKDMATGKIAMSYLGTWFPPQVEENGANINDIGMFPFPGVKALQIGPDWFHGVAASSKNINLAKAFLKYAWDGGKYATSTGMLSPMKNAVQDAKFIKELLSFGTPVIEAKITSDDWKAIVSKAQIDNMNIVQEYVLAKNPDEVVKKYNDKWAEAKKALGK